MGWISLLGGWRGIASIVGALVLLGSVWAGVSSVRGAYNDAEDYGNALSAICSPIIDDWDDERIGECIETIDRDRDALQSALAAASNTRLNAEFLEARLLTCNALRTDDFNQILQLERERNDVGAARLADQQEHERRYARLLRDSQAVRDFDACPVPSDVSDGLRERLKAAAGHRENHPAN